MIIIIININYFNLFINYYFLIIIHCHGMSHTAGSDQQVQIKLIQ